MQEVGPWLLRWLVPLEPKTWPHEQKEAFWSVCLVVAGFVPGAEFTELSEMPEFPLG